MVAKQALRAQVRAALAAMPPAQRALEEELVQAAVQAEPAWRDARTVLLYRAIPPELSVVGLTLAAWRAGKRVAFPRVVEGPEGLRLHEVGSWDGLRPGRFGVPEPAPASPEVDAAELDLAVVPGVAFDGSGGRLGRGGGYYDRLLARLACPAWGVAFSCQMVAQVPAEDHDRRVHAVYSGKWT